MLIIHISLQKLTRKVEAGKSVYPLGLVREDCISGGNGGWGENRRTVNNGIYLPIVRQVNAYNFYAAALFLFTPKKQIYKNTTHTGMRATGSFMPVIHISTRIPVKNTRQM